MATQVQQPAVSSEETSDSSQASNRGRGPSLNRVSLIGRLTADPVLRYTANGTALVRFRIANNGTDAVQFHNIVAWRKLGEIAAEYLSKGRLVYVDGHLKSRSWTAADGTSRWALDIVADEIKFLSPRPAVVAEAA